MRRLLIIPGLGDHDWAYRLTLPFWWLCGFRASVYGFDWRHDDGKFEERFKALLTYMESKGGKWYITGGSAGGVVAACVLFAKPGMVIRAVSICSPVTAKQLVSTNSVLHKAILALRAALPTADKEVRARLLSLWCQNDHVVAPGLTKLQGATQRQIPGKSHAGAIARALSFGSGKITAWLKTGQRQW